MPGSREAQHSSVPAVAAVIVGLIVIGRPPAGTLRSTILRPTAISPDASGNSGFQS